MTDDKETTYVTCGCGEEIIVKAVIIKQKQTQYEGDCFMCGSKILLHITYV